MWYVLISQYTRLFWNSRHMSKYRFCRPRNARRRLKGSRYQNKVSNVVMISVLAWTLFNCNIRERRIQIKTSEIVCHCINTFQSWAYVGLYRILLNNHSIILYSGLHRLNISNVFNAIVSYFSGYTRWPNDRLFQ